MEVICGFRMNGTMVSNEFIDQHMAGANGEYVKVYLYLMRHREESLELAQIADALNHTESDIKRALRYWEKLGALHLAGDPGEVKEKQKAETKPAAGRPTYSQDQINRLADDEDFTQLLYIAQKYLNKVFTQRECEVFAYLYDGLSMSAELLEYLTEYCVQGGHTSLRYLETVALNWHEKGLKTVEEAKAFASGFTKDSFAVMKAFGLTDRRPGEAEKNLIDQWFREYALPKEVILEACNRTMDSIHTPSFRYADKILQQWRKEGVKRIQDIELLDQNRKKKPAAPQNKKPANQFHNFEQRNTDYDSMMLDQAKAWIQDS